MCVFTYVYVWEYIYIHIPLTLPLRDPKGNTTPVAVSTPVSGSGFLTSPLKGTSSKTSLWLHNLRLRGCLSLVTHFTDEASGTLIIFSFLLALAS